MRIKKIPLLLLPALLSLNACYMALYEQPMPLEAPIITRIPEEITGVYEVIPSPEDLPEPGSVAELFHQYLVLERLDAQQMMVYTELRMPITALEQLRALLEIEKQEGRIMDFRLSQRMLWINSPGNPDNGKGPQSQVLYFTPSGKWLIHHGTYDPFGTIDLQKQVLIKMKKSDNPVSDEWVPESDSLETEIQRIDFRRGTDALYLNVETGAGRWQCISLSKEKQGRRMLNLSYVASKEDFASYLSKNLPAREFSRDEEDNFVLNVSNETFFKLQQTPSLWDGMLLQKVE